MTFSLNFRDLYKLFIVLLSTIILVTYLLFKFKKNNDLIVDSYKEILDLYSTCENNELDKKENIDDNLNKYKIYMVLISSIILLICLLLKFKKNIVNEKNNKEYIEETEEEYIEEIEDEEYIEEDDDYIEEENNDDYIEEDEEYLEETEEDKSVSNNKIKKVNLLLDKFEK